MRTSLRLALLALLLPGCRVVAPAYHRPALALPGAHRDADGSGQSGSLADLAWWDVFQDPALVALLGEALRSNQDLRLAAARVDESRALVGISAADGRPQVALETDLSRTRRSEAVSGGSLSDRVVNDHRVALGASWEIDLWGRIRRSTEAAWATYLASEQGRRAVLVALVGDVAQAYLELRGLDWQLDIARSTVGTRGSTRDLFQRRLEGGVGSELEVARAAGDLAGAAASVPAIEAAISQKENQLSLLLGRMPGPIARGLPLDAQRIAPQLPSGVPVALLDRRPDLLAAEQDLRAATALVGVARADKLPSLSLTALLGLESIDLEDLVTSQAVFASIGRSTLTPLLNGGRLRAAECAAQARARQAEATWILAVQGALRDVADALVLVKRSREISAQQALQVQARRRALDLGTQRFTGELASYFEVLDAQRELFPAELLLADAKKNELVAVVRLYRALGGGWNATAAPSASSAPVTPPPAPPACLPLPPQPAVPAAR